MPIPNPKLNEDQDKYISRCIAAISADHPGEGVAAGICYNTWREAKKSKNSAGGSNELDVEIFAVGTWNGMPFERTDLNMIAMAFHALHQVHQVPLKFGHNEDQPLTDGQPALGWVDNIWVADNKLVAHFTDLPDIVYQALQKKLYRNVSVELDLGVEHKGSYYPLVLSGVALLGADIPAVNTLSDLQAYMGRDELKFSKRLTFSVINGNNGGADMPTIEELQAENARLKAENATFAADKTALEGKVQSLEKDVQASAEEKQKAHFAAEKTNITTELDALVKANIITPAKREKFMADWKDDEAVIERLKFGVELLKESKPGTAADTREHGRQHDIETRNEDDKSVDDVLVSRTYKFQRENPGISFTDAKAEVLKQDPDLAIQYRDLNGMA